MPRLSENLDSVFTSFNCNSFSDAFACGREVGVRRCILLARSTCFRLLRPEGVWDCVDDNGDHVACRPTVDFVVEVLYASFIFEIPELVALSQSNTTNVESFPPMDFSDNVLDEKGLWNLIVRGESSSSRHPLAAHPKRCH
ncbi:hypothetical protein Vadar_025768 [Vaccinium darrowii]|uniref:Uncharacterized protein n=1 Tax=Vaccinium darrowii TaxID=229202 RepID=A0ACB7YG71_9ERIC|nr:hypothetical protein Vadar_025768 [Vaccinium darrowii]